MVSNGILCNLTCVFDIVNHSALSVEQLEIRVYAVYGSSFKLVMTVSSGKFVSMKNRFCYLSLKKKATSVGVPQGNVFGLLLFLIMIRSKTASLP